MSSARQTLYGERRCSDTVAARAELKWRRSCPPYLPYPLDYTVTAKSNARRSATTMKEANYDDALRRRRDLVPHVLAQSKMWINGLSCTAKAVVPFGHPV